MQDDEPGQVLIHLAQPVRDPGAHARPSRLLRSRKDEGAGRIVIDRVGIHRADDGQVVDDLGRVRQQLADPGARLAVTIEFEDGRSDGQTALARRHGRDSLPHPHRVRQVFVDHVAEFRLVVERFQLRRRAVHRQVDHPLGPCRKMRIAQYSAIAFGRGRRSRADATAGRTEDSRRIEQRGERRHADAGARAPEEVAAGHLLDVFANRIHGTSAFGNRLVEIQDHVGHDRPGGQLAGIDGGVGGRIADTDQAFGRFGVVGVGRLLLVIEPSEDGDFVGGGPSRGRQTKCEDDPLGGRLRPLREPSGPPGAGPLRRTGRRSSAPGPAAACWSGRGGPTHSSREGASKVISEGGGDVRFQNVYMLRR